MSDIRDWFRAATSNSDAAPDGAPEGMKRSDVNDAAREVMASVKIFYDDPDFRRPFEDYTLARVSSTIFTLTDGTVESNASLHLEVGQRLRLEGTSGEAGEFWEGFITIVVQSPSTICTITVAVWDSADSEDTTGPLNVPAYIEVGPKELGTAAWPNTGTADEEVPLNSDLDPHTQKLEVDLDVGFLDGQTRTQIAMAGARSRMNPNGGFDVWERGESFTAATPYINDADNVSADNWTILSDGDDRVDVSRDSGEFPSGIGVNSSLLFTAATVPGNQKHGAITFVELEDGLDVAGKQTTAKISLSFWAKLGGTTGIDAIRAYVINIKNREPTTSPVSDFFSGFTGNVSFNATDWELPTGGAVNPFLAVTLAATWTEYKIEGLEMDQNQVGDGGLGIAFIVDDATILSGAQWHIAAVQVNRGDKALPFIRTPAALERVLCLRYFESSFEPGTRPDDNAGVTHAMTAISAGTNIALDWRFSATKFKDPTIVTYNPSVTVPADDWYDGTNERAVSSIEKNRKGAHIYCTTATASTVHRIAVAAHANIWGNN